MSMTATPDWGYWRYIYVNRLLHNINPVNLWHNTPNPYMVNGFPGARDDLKDSYVGMLESLIKNAARPIANGLAILIPFFLFLVVLPMLP